MWQLQTPVAFLIFNRPDTTAQVFAEIARARPPQLLVVADGPRNDRSGEAEKCAAARAVIERVDWTCDVLTNYADVNLGCKRRVSSGLDWVFETVEEAIILEDDCLPHPTFFRFCAELLAKYRDDERVMHISGDNFQSGRKRGDASYYFSRYAHVWGWASWRRAWKQYDVNLTLWKIEQKKSTYLERFKNRAERNFWKKVFDRVSSGHIDTWDYQWFFACMTQNALSVVPNVNLVSNIGFRRDSTHTSQASVVANLPVTEMRFPIMHPLCFLKDDEADNNTRRLFFTAPGLKERISRRANAYLSILKVS